MSRASWAGPALAGLTVLALVLRVWALDRNPPGLDPDEVSIGYNAYSLLRTGRDEFGARWPLAFRAYGEYKRPMYVYAAVPSMAVFGPTVLGVRLPAAVAGALSVPALYAVGVLLLRDRRLALTAAGFLAISPWSVLFSHAAREVSIELLALIAGVALLLAAFQVAASLSAPCAPRMACGRTALGLLYSAAVAAFLVAVYAYPSGLVVVPLLVLAVTVSQRHSAARTPGWTLALVLALACAGLVPLAAQVRDGRALARAGQTSLLNRGQFATEVARRRRQDARDGWPAGFHYPWPLLGREVAGSYVAHFGPRFLFTEGDAEWRHHTSGFGQLYRWDLVPLLVGAIALARGWRRPAYRAIAGWLAIGPVPAALAENAPHAVRSIAMLPALYLLAALGAARLWCLLRHTGGWAARLQVLWLVLLALSFGQFLRSFYGDYPREHDAAWNSGWGEAFQVAQREVTNGHYRRVIIPPEVREGYVYGLYATGYDPRRYLAAGGSRVDPEWPLYPEAGPVRFPPFEVRRVEWAAEPRVPDTLYVLGSWNQLPAGARVLAVTHGASGRDALQVIYFPSADGVTGS